MVRMTHPSEPASSAGRQPLRWRIAFRLRGKSYKRGLRNRLFHALYDMRYWADWGHAVMALVGRDDCGNFSPPEPRAWYYTEAEWEQRGKRHRPRLIVAKSYDEYQRINGEMEAALEAWREQYRALPRDEQLAQVRDPERSKQSPAEPYWHYLNVQDDGAVLIPGNIYGERGGVNYGVDRRVARLLVRYVVVEWWLKANWLGIRPWLYWKALHRVVDFRRPFRCNQRPPKGFGAYDHWACQKRKRHDGEHRVHNYTWLDVPEVTYDPVT